MFNPSFDELKEKGINRYTLSLFLAKRARELVDGEEPLVHSESTRPVSIALEEFFSGKIIPAGSVAFIKEREELPEKINQILDDDDYYLDLEDEDIEDEDEDDKEDLSHKDDDVFEDDEVVEDDEEFDGGDEIDEEWAEDE